MLQRGHSGYGRELASKLLEVCVVFCLLVMCPL